MTLDYPKTGEQKERLVLDSTTVNLAASATYTSALISARHLKQVTLVVFADQATEWNVEQSADGVNWDVVPAVTARAASAKTVITPIDVVGTHVRWTLKNASVTTATTVVRGYLLGIGA